jgi:LPS export ABC transporter protein LptC
VDFYWTEGLICAIFKKKGMFKDQAQRERELAKNPMNKLAKSLLLVITLIVAYIIGGSIFSSPPHKGRPSHLGHSAGSQVDLAIWGLHLTETKGNELLWEIEADSAHMYQHQQSAQLKNIKLTLYQEQEPVLWLEGERAELNMESRDAAIEGKVVARYQDGLTFETDSLNWWNQRRLLSTPDKVRITKPHIQIQGRGLEADIGSERLRINNGVTTIIN